MFAVIHLGAHILYVSGLKKAFRILCFLLTMRVCMVPWSLSVCLFKGGGSGGDWVMITGEDDKEMGSGSAHRNLLRGSPGSHTDWMSYCCFCCLFFSYLKEATKLLKVHSWHFHHMLLALPGFTLG